MIEVKNLQFSFKSLKVIDNISFDLKDSEIISIVGPSGCGKSTILKILSGLLLPSSGKVNHLDKNINQSIVFQNDVLLPWRNVYENISLPLELKNNISRKEIIDKINLVGLNGFENSYPNELSGGMRQRVSLARALITNPSLLLMDEPFGSLDEMTRDNLNLELLNIHKKTKTTIVFVTHSISEAVFLSDRIIVLSDRPAKIKKIIDVRLNRPRTLDLKESMEFQKYIKWIRKTLD